MNFCVKYVCILFLLFLPIHPCFDPEYFISQLCPAFLSGNYTELEYETTKKWNFSDDVVFENVDKAADRCKAIKYIFGFQQKALSKEEEDFPLAYGAITYKNPAQFYFTLSAFYQPQNLYCIVVDGKSPPDFYNRIQELETCFSNVYVFFYTHDPIKWCHSSVLSAQYSCFRYLTLQPHKWKYYQYITGFDLPAKTNLEMVRIFKQLNGTSVIQVTIGGTMKIDQPKTKNEPIKFWKSGMSSVISRKAADSIFKVNKNYEMIEKIIDYHMKYSHSYGICSDEQFWATVYGNKKGFNVHGSFEARDLLKVNFSEWKMPHNTCLTLANPFIIKKTGNNIGNLVLARYQIWPGSTETCHGTFKKRSCVFGLKDLHSLLSRHELLFHKFYLDFEPMAYFCMWKSIKDRSQDPNQKYFTGTYYKLFPLVRLYHGESVEEAVKFPSNTISFKCEK